MGARPKQTKAPIKTVAPLSHNIDVLENDERGDDEHGTEEEEEEEPSNTAPQPQADRSSTG